MQWYQMTMKDDAEKLASIQIYDEIGGWGIDAKSFVNELNALGEIEEIELRLNSPGGSVIEGIAIFNALVQHPAKVTAYIDGWAASMASIIAMAADEINMPENTYLMVHNPWTVAIGDADELRKNAELLETMQETAISAYQRHSELSREEIQNLMDEETWIIGSEVNNYFKNINILEVLEVAASVRAVDGFTSVPEAAQVWVVAEEVAEETEEIEEEVVKDAIEEPTEEASVEDVVESDISTADSESQDNGDSEVVEESTDAEQPEMKMDFADKLLEMKEEIVTQFRTQTCGSAFYEMEAGVGNFWIQRDDQIVTQFRAFTTWVNSYSDPVKAVYNRVIEDLCVPRLYLQTGIPIVVNEVLNDLIVASRAFLFIAPLHR